MSNLLIRTITGIILGTIAIVSVLYLPLVIFKLAIAGISTIASWEVANLLKRRCQYIDPYFVSIVGFFSSISVLFFDPFLALLIIFLYSFYISHKYWDLDYLSFLVFSLVYSVFFVSSIGLLIDVNRYLILILFATVWSGDTFAYFVGKNLGKHKLAPRLSPKKTWEGAFGSVIGSLLVGGATAYYFEIYSAFIPIVISSVVLQIGDLFESFIKRQVDVKDSSHLIPGHGGILDRIDALIFASIVFLIFYNLKIF